MAVRPYGWAIACRAICSGFDSRHGRFSRTDMPLWLELVDTTVSKAVSVRSSGSSPDKGTGYKQLVILIIVSSAIYGGITCEYPASGIQTVS